MTWVNSITTQRTSNNVFNKPDACAGKTSRDGNQVGTVWDTGLENTRAKAGAPQPRNGVRLTKGSRGSADT